MKTSNSTATKKRSYTKRGANAPKYTKIAKNVYLYPTGKYRVVKMVKGLNTIKWFTAKAVAVKYAKSL